MMVRVAVKIMGWGLFSLININIMPKDSCLIIPGKVILDVYVKPALPVTDYRTRYSGIRQFHLKTQNSVGFEEAIDMV